MLKNKKISIVFLFVCIFLSSVFTTISYADVITYDSTYGISEMVNIAPTEFNKVVLNEIDSNMVLDIIEYLTNNNMYDTNTYVYYIGKNYSTGEYNIFRYDKSDSAKPYYVKVTYGATRGYNFRYDFSGTGNTKQKANVTLDTNGDLLSISSFSKFTSSYYMTFGFYTYEATTPNYTLYTGYDISYDSSNTWRPLYNSLENWGITFFSNSVTTAQGTIDTLNPKLTTNTPDDPTLPTNEEIANAVQKFYDSDIYKNNKTFKDFVVVYSALKNTYSFICFERPFTQFIFYDGFEYDGFSSSDTWWKFMFSEDLTSILFRDKFFLYFIEGNSDVITNEGVGFLSDLSDLKFSMNMTIVYSTRDYVVVEHRPPAEGETENQITTGTIEGDSYTYDENLNPTDSQYSPLENNVSSSPTESILNDVDFNTINKVFEDSKTILNIENASWLFTANNQLVNYFAVFITFIIILFAISRVLGG